MQRTAKELQGFDPARRAALLKLGRFAVYTAPVMSALLIGREAEAHDPPPPNYCVTGINDATNSATRQHYQRHCASVGSTGASPAAESFSDQKSKDQPSSDGF